MIPEGFGERLKGIRKFRKLTQTEMSKLLKISRQAYSNYEQGRCIPPITTLLEMSVILNSNLLLCFFTPATNFSSIFNATSSEIPDFEISALISLYKSMNLKDRLLITENMLTKLYER